MVGKNTGIPRERREETAASTMALRRPMMAMEAPCLPNCVEISNPMPEAPPVKRATFPFRISGLKGDSIGSVSQLTSQKLNRILDLYYTMTEIEMIQPTKTV